MAITSFKGEYRFLSNFYPCSIKPFENMGMFPTVEHAYVAYKTNDYNIREYIRNIETPAKAKRYGREELMIVKDWDDLKISVMKYLIDLKFKENSRLAKKLLDTGSETLVEGNNHGDKFWGQCPIGTGYNHLGKLLMGRRSILNIFYT